jgi:hypothetical protein
LTAESSLVTKLQAAANETFTNTDRIVKFVTFPHGGSFDPDHIIDIKTVTGVEVGKMDRGRRLHLHVQFKIRHRTWVRLDPAAIKAEINAVLEESGYPHQIHYIHISVHRPELEDYIGKD